MLTINYYFKESGVLSWKSSWKSHHNHVFGHNTHAHVSFINSMCHSSHTRFTMCWSATIRRWHVTARILNNKFLHRWVYSRSHHSSVKHLNKTLVAGNWAMSTNGEDNLLLIVEAANILEQRRRSSSDSGKTAHDKLLLYVTTELINGSCCHSKNNSNNINEQFDC